MPKKDIHPKWYDEAKVFCDGQLIMTVGSTKPELNVDIWSGNHPFYTGSETMLDSDDTLHKDFVKNIKEIPAEYKGAIILRDGYIYSTKDRLAKWHNPISNQNYTIIFPKDIYYNPEKRLKYLDGLKTHEEVPIKFKCVELKDMYCSITHGQNMSTEWGHPFMGEEIFNEETKNLILHNYV
jgi:large subunit ribosomal protein L31